MHRDTALIAEPLQPGLFGRGMSEAGQQYALYIHHSENIKIEYIVQAGDYQDILILAIAAGCYQAEWINPQTGERVGREQFHHNGGNRSFTTPHYTIDLALRIVAK